MLKPISLFACAMFRVVVLISGGKDSIFSLLECICQGHEIVALVNMQPPELENAYELCS